MIAAQVISIAAFLISWVWWVTFAIGLIALLLLQIIWCCRQTKAGFLASAAVSALAALMCVVSGIIMLVAWKDATWCDPFIFINQDMGDDYYNHNRDRDYCQEGAWATVAFVSGALWFAVTGCIIYFLKSGRHTKWEEKLCNSKNSGGGDVDVTTATALEMGTVQHGGQTTRTMATASDTGGGSASIATATTPAAGDAVSHDAAVTMMAADSYVPPEISNKVDGEENV